MIVRPRRLCAALAVLLCSCSVGMSGLMFNITNSGGATAPMMTGFAQACAMWSAVLDDPVTINITVNAGVLQSGQIAGTSAYFDRYVYADVRNALLVDAKSGDDASSAAALQPSAVFSMLINRTKNSPYGTVNAKPYFDTGLGGVGQAGDQNNGNVRITSANAKALGIYPGNANDHDGIITFSTIQSYDFDRSDGIDSSKVDFVGVATHEIGHLLGFLSGVETLDANGGAPGLNDNQLSFVTPLDLFRFSSRSTGTGGGAGVIDWTADNTTKYFSVDGGLTSLAPFSNGSDFGDGYEAHHWKVDLGLGIMDPTAALGELLTMSELDLRSFDVIGYDLAAVPEPSSLALVGFLALAKGAAKYRRRRAAG